MDMDDIWFQQEICHTARKTIQLLYESFPGRNFPFLIRIGRIVQFFFGFLKFKIYTDKPTTTYILKKKIKRYINKIQPHLYKMIKTENFNKRVRMCQQNRGGHSSDMLLSYITLYCTFHESIKNLQFLITNFCFLSKLLLAGILGCFL